MKKKCAFSAIGLALAVLFLLVLPFGALAGGAEGRPAEYDKNDIKAVMEIAAQAGLDLRNTPEKPESWPGWLVSWDERKPARVYELNLSGMEGLTGTLNMSGLPELKVLYCYDSPIATLDVSGNPKLESLYCSGLQITALDLSGNPALELLSCQRSPITELDLSGNPELRDLLCYDTGIAELDLRGNPKLEELHLRGTEITELNLSGNAKLRNLVCSSTAITRLDLSGNPELWMLNCADTGLTALDLSGSPWLSWINVTHTTIVELNLKGLQWIDHFDLANSPWNILFDATHGPTRLTGLTAFAGGRVTVESQGNGEAYISDYDDDDGVVKCKAIPGDGARFLRWELISPEGATDGFFGGEENEVSCAVGEKDVHLLAVFK